MKQKSDVHIIIPKFLSLIETQFHKTIKAFRSDNAPKLRFTEFFSKKGVLYQFSCPECPKQSFVVKRKHQHLLNVARALFFQSQVPILFWGDCVLTATYLINRTLHLLGYIKLQWIITFLKYLDLYALHLPLPLIV